MEKGYKNISVLFFLIFCFVIVGFYKTYFSLFPTFQNVTIIQHIHGILFILWFGLLIIQPILIRNGRYNAHKLIGKTTYILVPCIIISIHFIAREGYLKQIEANTPKNVAIANLYLATHQIVDFFLLYVLAMVNVKRTSFHMRYMIATSLAIVGAGVRRVFTHELCIGNYYAILFGFLIPDVILMGLIIYDRIKGKESTAYVISFIILAISHYSYYFIPYSSLWQKTFNYLVKIF